MPTSDPTPPPVASVTREPWTPPTVAALLDYLDEDIANERHRRANKGGQQCGPSGDIYGAPPSMITRLERLVRDLREADNHHRSTAAAQAPGSATSNR